MHRRIICLLGAACMVLVIGTPARALERTGTVRVTPEWDGEAVTGGTVKICRVGCAVTEGYQLTDGLANWFVEEREVYSGAFLNRLARQVTEGETCPVKANGALFTDLKEGLYLVKQSEAASGFYAFSPFLLELPQGECWEIEAQPRLTSEEESPKTGDHPAPIIGAMGIGFSAAALMVLIDERRK